jgi:hypothetical protein
VVGTHIGVCSLLRLPIAMGRTVRSPRRCWRGISDDFHHGLLTVACQCKETFGRWITPEEAAQNLVVLARLD